LSSAVEQTVKALVEFESELDRAKSDAADTKRRVSKDAANWGDSAKASAVSKAQEIASQRVAKAKEDAEAQAERIRRKGESDLKSFEESLSRHRSEAARLVAARLLGESA